jgi:ElaB/YqjD/DUF883 family membrane-anchored ribosome-binding protein
MSKHHNRHHHGEESTESSSGERASGDSVQARVASGIQNARTSVGNMIPTTNDVRNLAGHAVGVIEKNPIGALLSAFAVGFLAGSLLPSTPVEDERLGALKGTLQNQAQGVGAQALQHGKAVIRDTIEAAQHSARQHGAEFAEEIRTSGA